MSRWESRYGAEAVEDTERGLQLRAVASTVGIAWLAVFIAGAASGTPVVAVGSAVLLLAAIVVYVQATRHLARAGRSVVRRYGLRRRAALAVPYRSTARFDAWLAREQARRATER